MPEDPVVMKIEKVLMAIADSMRQIVSRSRKVFIESDTSYLGYVLFEIGIKFRDDVPSPYTLLRLFKTFHNTMPTQEEAEDCCMGIYIPNTDASVYVNEDDFAEDGAYEKRMYYLMATFYNDNFDEPVPGTDAISLVKICKMKPEQEVSILSSEDSSESEKFYSGKMVTGANKTGRIIHNALAYERIRDNNCSVVSNPSGYTDEYMDAPEFWHWFVMDSQQRFMVLRTFPIKSITNGRLMTYAELNAFNNEVKPENFFKWLDSFGITPNQMLYMAKSGEKNCQKMRELISTASKKYATWREENTTGSLIDESYFSNVHTDDNADDEIEVNAKVLPDKNYVINIWNFYLDGEYYDEMLKVVNTVIGGLKMVRTIESPDTFTDSMIIKTLREDEGVIVQIPIRTSEEVITPREFGKIHDIVYSATSKYTLFAEIHDWGAKSGMERSISQRIYTIAISPELYAQQKYANARKYYFENTSGYRDYNIFSPAYIMNAMKIPTNVMNKMLDDSYSFGNGPLNRYSMMIVKPKTDLAMLCSFNGIFRLTKVTVGNNNKFTDWNDMNYPLTQREKSAYSNHTRIYVGFCIRTIDSHVCCCIYPDASGCTAANKDDATYMGIYLNIDLRETAKAWKVLEFIGITPENLKMMLWNELVKKISSTINILIEKRQDA